MDEKLEAFKVKVSASSDEDLIDSLVLYVKKSDENISNYEATKILKKELLQRLKSK